MKRYQYVVAATCLCLCAMGIVGLYATNQTKEKEELARNEQIVEESENRIANSGLLDTKEENVDSQKNQVADIDEQADVENNENIENEADIEDYEEIAMQSEINQEDSIGEEVPVGTITEEALHFRPENGLVWPIEGSVLLDYSMESTIFFPTLQQYQYNPAMVLSGSVNDKVYFIAKGKITNIETNEVTGCTVTQDIGDGYTAIYGQLKELNFDVGDMVESGQVVGYVGEPTKYYSVEGSNVYFQLLKNGVPVDPEEILP